MRVLLNPGVLFAFVWSVTLWLYSSRLSYILEPIKNETIILLCCSMVAFLLPFLVYLIIARRPCFYPYFDVKKYKYQIANIVVSKKIKIVTCFWLLFSIIEVIHARNFPLFSLLGVGPHISYVDFGVRGFHGLLNAIYLFLTCFYFLKFKAENKNKYLFILLLLLLWPVFLATRQLLVSYFLQLFFIHLLTTKINTKKIVKLICFVIVAFSIFGYLGDLRSGRDHIISLSQPTFEYPDYLPSFFIWVYIYMVSPLNNINHNIAEIDPLYFPFNSITSLLPSFLRKVVSTGLEIKSHDTELVAEAFNISTFFEPFLKDFGYMLLPFVLVVFSMVSVAVMHKASNKVMYVFILAVMLHSITLSVFANFFTHLVFVFQMVIPIFIFKLKVR